MRVGKQAPIVHCSLEEKLRQTKKGEYLVTGYYIREYVKGLQTAKKRAFYIAKYTKRWGKVERIPTKNHTYKKQYFICVMTNHGLDYSSSII